MGSIQCHGDSGEVTHMCSGAVPGAVPELEKWGLFQAPPDRARNCAGGAARGSLTTRRGLEEGPARLESEEVGEGGWPLGPWHMPGRTQARGPEEWS